MPRETWRDDPEYVALWREARQGRTEAAPGLVLSDWLMENGHVDEGWRERLRALAGHPPEIDAEVARAGFVPVGGGTWRLLLAAPPPEEMLVVFTRNVPAYQYVRRFTGRCGWDVGACDFPSETERSHLLAIPRLELFAARLMTPEGWDWVTASLSDLTHLEADGAMIGPDRLSRLRMLPRLRHLSLRGRAAADTRAISTLSGLRHLALGPYTYSVARLAELAPDAESIFADVEGLAEGVPWPRLRSFRMLPHLGEPLLGDAELIALAARPTLERLSIRCGDLGPSAVEAIAGLPHLGELSLRVHRGAVPSLAALARCPALESLTVEGQVSDEQLEEIAGATGLRSLLLTAAHFGKRGLDALARMRNLESLRLEGEYGGRKPPEALARLPRLEKLTLGQMRMPAGSVPALREAAAPWLECLLPGD